jgi:methionyl-tRNA formyltransferase
MKGDLRVLVLAKERPGLKECIELLRKHSGKLRVHIGRRGDPLPPTAKNWEGDLLVSYLSAWIVPGPLLRRARAGAVNFHPGPPEYPGTGCTNFALYRGERRYGVTAHHMEARVDTGRIIAVRRFPIGARDTVQAVTLRAYEHLRALFRKVMTEYFRTGRFPSSGESWKRTPYTRRDLEQLCRITPDMPRREVERRIRATTFPGMPGAYVEIHGHRFCRVPRNVFPSARL